MHGMSNICMGCLKHGMSEICMRYLKYVWAIKCMHADNLIYAWDI